MKFRIYALGCRTVFLSEKRNEPYKKYGEVIIAEENSVLGQELTQGSQLGWMACGRGA